MKTFFTSLITAAITSMIVFSLLNPNQLVFKGTGVSPIDSNQKISPNIPDLKNKVTSMIGRPIPEGITTDSDVLKLSGFITEIPGGVWFNSVGTIGLPNCSESLRGLLWFSASKTGFADQLLLCLKDSGDKYSWEIVH